MGKADCSCLSGVRDAGLHYRSTSEPIRVVWLLSEHSSTREDSNMIELEKSGRKSKGGRVKAPLASKTAAPSAPREISWGFVPRQEPR
jgi:hypothetical protein